MKLDDETLYVVSTLKDGVWRKHPKQVRKGSEWNLHISAFSGDLGRFQFVPVVSEIKCKTQMWMDQIEAKMLEDMVPIPFNPEPKDKDPKYRFIRPVRRGEGRYKLFGKRF